MYSWCPSPHCILYITHTELWESDSSLPMGVIQSQGYIMQGYIEVIMVLPRADFCTQSYVTHNTMQYTPPVISGQEHEQLGGIQSYTLDPRPEGPVPFSCVGVAVQALWSPFGTVWRRACGWGWGSRSRRTSTWPPGT